MTEYRTEDPDFVKMLIKRMWTNAGASDAHAEAIAHVVTQADRLGKHQQGLGVLEVLYPAWRAGNIDLDAEPSIADEGPTWIVVDGNRSTGFYTLTIGIKHGIERARSGAVCLVLARNHWDAGGFGAYSMMAAREGMVAMVTNTTPPLATPIGGIDNVMSAAPLTLAAPGGERHPVLVDLKTSETYEGELTQAILEDRPFGQAVLVDPETGDLTDDPAPYRVPFEDGVYNRFSHYMCGATFATHRQQSINVLVELLCAMVPGGLVTSDLPQNLLEYEREGGEGPTTVPASFALVIDPSHFIDPQEFTGKIDRYADAVKGVRRRAGASEIFLPGERGQEAVAREPDQMRILQIHWDAFTYWAGEMNVDIEAVRAEWESRPDESGATA